MQDQNNPDWPGREPVGRHPDSSPPDEPEAPHGATRREFLTGAAATGLGRAVAP
jgi:hypothetical protein